MLGLIKWSAQMNLRKNIRSLTEIEIETFTDALVELKRKGIYDKFVHWHHHVMNPSIWPWEPNDPNYRNGAHRGPSFLPWHREFLVQLETELQKIDSSITLPYWNWTEESANPESSILWKDNFLGGNGLESDSWRVQTGKFSHSTGNWPVPAYPSEGYPEEGLKRQFGLITPSIPTEEDVALALRESFYDTPPYNQSPFTVGFRNRLEGWVTQRGDPSVTTEGTQLHNRIHVWVGGNMLLMTSPDDPVFFLHHCYVDKVWADWQSRMAERNPNWAPHYAPLKDGPSGHNIDDVLNPWARTVREVLDPAALGYEYGQPVSLFSTSKNLLPDEKEFISPFVQ